MISLFRTTFILALAALFAFSGTAQPQLSINPESARFCTATIDKATGITSIVTGAKDQQIIANLPNGASLDPSVKVLTFEYQCPEGIQDFQLFFAPELKEKNSVMAKLPATNADQWATFTLHLTDVRDKMNWANTAGNWYIRLDWGNDADKHIRVRNIVLRQPTTDEKLAMAQSAADLFFKEMLGANIESYLYSSYPCRITDVEVTPSNITISGETDGKAGYQVAEVLPYENLTELKKFVITKPVSGKKFRITVARKANYDGFKYDRSLSKWVIISDSGTSQQISSHALYASKMDYKNNPTAHKPFNKKGMLGIAFWPDNDGIVDIDTMNCGTLGIGITLNNYFHLTRHSPEDVEFSYGGRTYYADGKTVRNTDNMVRTYNRHNCYVLCYVRCYPADLSWTDSEASKVLLHPQCSGGFQCAMNIATPEGLNAVAACMDFIGKRYSQPGMRIHIWATQNEVNANKMWCNLGDNSPEMYFTDYYTRLMRVMANTLQPYDPNAAILAVFEHNWARISGNGSQYPSRNMLDKILLFSETEGDFRWGVGAHPYPAHQPDFWVKDVAPEVTFDQSSPKVTFKNLEVLNDWALNTAHFYKKTEKRPVFLCENGVSSVDNTEHNLTLQAAGAAYAWKKANALPGIDSFMWYSPSDYSTDFGLLLGLRFSGDNKAHPYERKPSWHVWQAAGSDREDEVFAPYLKVIGIDSWDQIWKH